MGRGFHSSLEISMVLSRRGVSMGMASSFFKAALWQVFVCCLKSRFCLLEQLANIVEAECYVIFHLTIQWT